MIIAGDRRPHLLDAALLQPGARHRASGLVKFQCPECRAEGHDAHQDNAALFTHDGSWGCAYATKDCPDGRRHWDAIGVALGAFEERPPRSTSAQERAALPRIVAETPYSFTS